MKVTLAFVALAMLVTAPIAQAASVKLVGKVMKIEMGTHRIHMMDKNKEMTFDFGDLCGDGAKLTAAQKTEAGKTCSMFKTMKENDDISVTYMEAANHGDHAMGEGLESAKK